MLCFAMVMIPAVCTLACQLPTIFLKIHLFVPKFLKQAITCSQCYANAMQIMLAFAGAVVRFQKCTLTCTQIIILLWIRQWNRIDQYQIRCLVRSMRRRCNKVMDNVLEDTHNI